MKPPRAIGDRVGLAEVRSAEALLAGVARRTPFTRESVLDRVGATIWLKHEERQETGSFKFRGAYTASALYEFPRVCTVSSGNHGRALARSGRLLGRQVQVHMPHDAPEVKVSGVRAEGAEVVQFHRYRTPQSVVTCELAADPDYVYISAHDDPAVIAGAGTIGLELLQDLPDLEVIVVPIGGGGAAAGIGLVARGHNPGIRVIGVEPASGGVTKASLLAGRRLTQPVPRTIADGQTLTTPGELTFSIMQDVVDEVVLVDDSDIRAALVALEQRCGVRAEPSGACATAALVSGKLDRGIRNRRVAVIVSGGNSSRGW